ncbi:PEP-CTERM sorting domain-containing protein (plasmid) [Verrucomicrobiaceae bacterium 227]
MKRTLLSLSASMIACGAASAVITFRSDFDEANLAAISGLNVDTPNTDLGTADSGTVTLNTGNQTLDLATNGANAWAAREGAPIAWVSTPSVAIGEKWYAETQITFANSTGDNSEWDQAGMTFYSGILGNSPGSENTGTHQSLFVGISDWNAWDHRVQGLADNDPNIAVGATATDDNFFYRVEITENGVSDLYNFFYKEDAADAWTQFGDLDLEQDFDNSAVGMFIKAHNNNTTASTGFDYFEVGTLDSIPEPSTSLLAGLAGLSFALRRRRK